MKYFEALMLFGSVLGSVLVASNTEVSKFGYILFVIGSTAGIFVGLKSKLNSLTLMSSYFTIVNVYGIWRWFV